MQVYIKKKHPVIASLSSKDCRLLLGASLRLLVHRFSCGQSIYRDDLIRLVSLVDVGVAHPICDDRNNEIFEVENGDEYVRRGPAEAGAG
jgi:hypothetical protein